MSVYKPAGSPFYQFDFQWRGHRFHGTTKCKSRREAEAFERAERERAKQQVAQEVATTDSVRLDDIAARYWQDVGQHHTNSEATWRDLCRVVDYFGKDKLITEITENDVAKFVAWRRGHRVVRKQGQRPEDCPLISNATVNRTTMQFLKKLFIKATAWNVKFENKPDWKKHILKEPDERVRELVGDEESRLEKATRADYAPYFLYIHTSGVRLQEGVLRWSNVNWEAGQITTTGKNKKIVTVPITTAIRELLLPLVGHHPEWVFTYLAKRTREGRVKGERYPITNSGIKSTWRRIRKRAKLKNFRLHDLRHDFATKLLRHSRNLKLVQKALGHSDIETTMKYAHVLDEEVAAALESVQKSRKKSRNEK